MATQNMWQSTNPAGIVSGCTGDSSFSTTYSVLCAGTTTTNPVQVLNSNGSSGQVLTSQGASLPIWQTIPSAQGALILLQTQTVSSPVASVVFNSNITSTYLNYIMIINNIVGPITGTSLNMDWSVNGGITYLNSGYMASTASHRGSTSTVTRSSSTTTGVLTGPSATFDLSVVVYSTTLSLFGLASTTDNPMYIGNYVSYNVSGSAPLTVDGTCYGYNTTLLGINAIKFSFADGSNFTDGNFSLYGIQQ